MAKQTWVNIGGTWRKVKSVWVNVNGTWKKDVMPKGVINGEYKEFMSYYEDGFFSIARKSSNNYVLRKYNKEMRLEWSRNVYEDVNPANLSVIPNKYVALSYYSDLDYPFILIIDFKNNKVYERSHGPKGRYSHDITTDGKYFYFKVLNDKIYTIDPDTATLVKTAANATYNNYQMEDAHKNGRILLNYRTYSTSSKSQLVTVDNDFNRYSTWSIPEDFSVFLKAKFSSYGTPVGIIQKYDLGPIHVWKPYSVGDLVSGARVITIDFENNIYVYSASGEKLYKFNYNLTPLFTKTIKRPTGNGSITVGSDGNVFITSANNSIIKLDKNGNELKVINTDYESRIIESSSGRVSIK